MQSQMATRVPSSNMLFLSQRRRLKLVDVPTLDVSNSFRYNSDYFDYSLSHSSAGFPFPVVRPPSTDVTEWQVNDVLRWLDSICLTAVDYAETFKTENIDGNTLLTLTKEGLHELVDDSDDRARIYLAMLHVQEKARVKRLQLEGELEPYLRQVLPGSKCVRFRYTDGRQVVLDLQGCQTLFKVMQLALRQVLPITDRETVSQWALTREPFPKRRLTEEEVMAAIEMADISLPINVVLASTVSSRPPPPPTPSQNPTGSPSTPVSVPNPRSWSQSPASPPPSRIPSLGPLGSAVSLETTTGLSVKKIRQPAAAISSFSSAVARSAENEKTTPSPPRNYSFVSPPTYHPPSTDTLRQKAPPLQQVQPLQINRMLKPQNMQRNSVFSSMSSMSGSSMFSNERPSSRQVSMNLQGYFPNASRKELAETVRRSVLFQKRASMLDEDERGLSKRFSNLVVVPPECEDKDVEDIFSKRESVGTLTGKFGSKCNTLTEADIRASSISTTFPNSPPESDTHSLINPENEENEIEAELNNIDEQLKTLDDIDQAPAGWIRGMLIGTGSFGEVFMGINPMNGELMAVKQVEIPANPAEARRQKMVATLRHEISLMRNLDHENIVQYRGFESDNKFVNIFLEYVSGGSLSSLLSQYGAFQESLARHYARQTLSGLAYLHAQGIIHRDIKAANVLVNDRGLIKISDFGLSKQIQPQELMVNGAKRQSMQGSAFWMAPEIVNGKEQTTPKADIWSFGCLMIELVTGTHPFPNLTQMQAIFKVGNMQAPEVPPNASPELKDFLIKCLELKSALRPSAEELLKHPFLNAEN